MPMTVRQLLDGMRFRFQESGMQTEWNRLNQALTAESPGTGVTAGDTPLDTYVVGSGTAASLVIERDAAKTISGPFAAAGGVETVTGEKVPPPDPGGDPANTDSANSTPHPRRLANRLPTAGFRPSA